MIIYAFIGLLFCAIYIYLFVLTLLYYGYGG